jgi:hypothetical protein
MAMASQPRTRTIHDRKRVFGNGRIQLFILATATRKASACKIASHCSPPSCVPATLNFRPDPSAATCISDDHQYSYNSPPSAPFPSTPPSFPGPAFSSAASHPPATQHGSKHKSPFHQPYSSSTARNILCGSSVRRRLCTRRGLRWATWGRRRWDSRRRRRWACGCRGIVLRGVGRRRSRWGRWKEHG